VRGLGTGVAIGLIQVVKLLFDLLTYLIVAAALVTWVSPDPRNPIVQFLYRSTEWLLKPCRKILPPRRTGGIDFSPIIAILLLVLIKAIVLTLMTGGAYTAF
jgi:YggT family protein